MADRAYRSGEGATFGDELSLMTAEAATSTAVLWAGGTALWSIWGTWAGATATLQYSPDDGTTWLDMATATANGGVNNIPLPNGKVRVAISGGPPSLTSVLQKVV